MANIEAILSRYKANAPTLGVRYGTLSAQDVLRPVAEYLPAEPADIADIGAGSGRDANWLVARGHRVTAVEPVKELARTFGPIRGVEWIDDRLPDLKALRARRKRFDLILLVAVWHHLDEAQRRVAMFNLVRLIRPGGGLILSLRQGDVADDRLICVADAGLVVAQACAAGLECVAKLAAPAVQDANTAAGVSWVWLVFRRPDMEGQN